MKKEIQENFKYFSAEEQEILSALTIICREGLSEDVACDIIMPGNPHKFLSYIGSFNEMNWLTRDVKTIYFNEIVSDVVQEMCPVTDEWHNTMLSALLDQISLKPLDDMYAKREHFKAARLYLTHLMETWGENGKTKPEELIAKFAYSVRAFALNAELSLADFRQRNEALETRIDFQLLNYVLTLSAPYIKSDIHTLLGSLFNQIFRYDEAKEHFTFAEASVPKGDESLLLMAKSGMYKNLSVTWKAALLAYKAYEYNERNGDNDKNLSVSLHIAYLCAYCKSKENAGRWLQRFRDLVGQREIPQHHQFRIVLKETEAYIHEGDCEEKLRILDEAELEIYRLYGINSPEEATVSYMCSLIEAEASLSRKDNEGYGKYVALNHFNYGQSRGDTAVLYSGLTTSHFNLGNRFTAGFYSQLLEEIDPADTSFAPGVRTEQAWARLFGKLSEGNVKAAKEHLDISREIIQKEIRFYNEEDLQQLKKVFSIGSIPDNVLGTDWERMINNLEITMHLATGDTGTAKQRLKSFIESETNTLERLKWKVRMGDILALEQDRDGAMTIWQEVLEEAEKKDIFSLCESIAESADNYNMTFEALEFINIALQYDNMIHAETNELANVLNTQARILKTCGMENSEEPWKNAERLLQSLNDHDLLSNLYFNWSILHQGIEKVKLLQEAIKYWKPEKGHFDERLAYMYHHLAIAFASLRLIYEAREAEDMAVRLFPTLYPEDLTKEFEEIL